MRVRDLTAQLWSRPVPILDGVNFELGTGEALGILGESGAGKTTLARALMRMLPSEKWTLRGSVQLAGAEILQAGEQQLDKIRGAQISLIVQEPELALNPVLSVGKQIDEVLRAHTNISRGEREQQIQAMLTAVGLADPKIFSAFPHELSGGQRQRVVIAQSLVSRPRLLIADEPTSALDTVTQADVLTVLKGLKERLQLALIFITHNPALLSGLAERVLILSEGRVLETGTLEQISPRLAYGY